MLCWWAAKCCLSISFPHGHCWQRGRIQPCLIRSISQMWILRFISGFRRCKNMRFLACIRVNALYGHRAAYIVNKLFTGARGKILPGIFIDMMDFSKLNKASAVKVALHIIQLFFPSNKNRTDNLSWNLSDIRSSSLPSSLKIYICQCPPFSGNKLLVNG